MTFAFEPQCHPPRWRLISTACHQMPCASQFIFGDAVIGAPLRVAQIRNVAAIDVIATQNAGVDLMPEALIGFLYCAYRTQRQIESRHSLGIEPAAMDRCAVSRNRFERPSRIVRAIARSDKSQAKPPMAMESK